MSIGEFETLKNKSINFVIENAELFGKLETIARINNCSNKSFFGDVILNGTISLKNIKEIFMFKLQEYTNQITCIKEPDILFKQDLTKNNEALLKSVINSKYIDNDDNNIDYQGTTIGVEYIQNLAFNLFGSKKAMSIIDNRMDIVREVEEDFYNIFKNYFITNATGSFNSNCPGITKKLMETILKLDNKRLNICGIKLGSIAEIIETKDYQGVPFALGDTLIMKYSIIDNNNHINRYNNIRENHIRSYIIKLEVIEDDLNDNITLNNYNNICEFDNSNNYICQHDNSDICNCNYNNCDNYINDNCNLDNNETSIFIDF